MITEQSKISYIGYNNSEYDNICVAMCFFNPINYINNIKNINIIIQELNKTNISYYIIDLIYPGQSSSIPESTITVEAETFFFVKENLWNILEKHIPNKYENIIFLDCDIIFSDPDWINKVSEKLKTNKVVHASEYLYRDIKNTNIYEAIYPDNKNTKQTIVKAIKYETELNLFKYSPGYNICINRNFYHKIGGFFDKCPVTIGDTLFWSCFKPDHRLYAGTFFCAPNFKKQKIHYITYKKNVNTLCNTNDIDYIEDNFALHLYHGSVRNRNYGKQFSFIPGPFTLFYNKDGVIEIKIKHPLIKDLKKYFESRKEDDDNR